MAARLIKRSTESLSPVSPAAPRLASREGLSSSPRASAVIPPAAAAATAASSQQHDGLLTRMRAVLKRHQCGDEEAAVSACMQAAGSGGIGACSDTIQTFRHCQLVTAQHNYPVAPAFMY